MSTLRSRVRVERSKRELDRLQGQIAAWVGERQKRDVFRQYQTQLAVLGGVLSDGIGRVRAALDAVRAADGPGQPGAAYRACAGHDQRTLLIRRAWEYFRVKFDQRDDPALAPVLRAADEVTWSLYAQPFRALGLTPGPAPLAYVEPLYSPRAIPRIEPPRDLAKHDEVLSGFLRQLPIPLVGLPSSCAVEPWSLALLGHEVGHHVQFDLLPDHRLVGIFEDRLRVAAARLAGGGGPLGPGDAEVWAGWGREIFADAFSVAALGPAAARAMLEIELSDDARMLDSGDVRYPPAVVRLALLAEVTRALGADPTSLLEGFVPEAFAGGDMGVPARGAAAGVSTRSTRALAHLAAARAVAEEIAAAPLEEAGTLEALCAFSRDDYAPGAAVDGWAEALSGGGALHPEGGLSGARRVLSGAMIAWVGAAAIEDDARRARALDDLRRRALAMLAESREEATRSAAAPARAEVAELGDALWSALHAGDAPE